MDVQGGRRVKKGQDFYRRTTVLESFNFVKTKLEYVLASHIISDWIFNAKIFCLLKLPFSNFSCCSFGYFEETLSGFIKSKCPSEPMSGECQLTAGRSQLNMCMESDVTETFKGECPSETGKTRK